MALEEPEPVAAPPILPEQQFFVLLAEPLLPDEAYDLTVRGVLNINSLGGGGGETLIRWEPPEPPPTDTAAVVPDTAGVPPDTSAVLPDTTGVPPDTSGVPPDTSGVAALPRRWGRRIP